MNVHNQESGAVPSVVVGGVLAVFGMCLAIATLLASGIFVAGGHGTDFPYRLAMAPFGLGVIIWPVSMALFVSSGRWKVVVAIVVLCIREVIIWWLYDIESAAAAALTIGGGSIGLEVTLFISWITFIDVVCSGVLIRRLVWVSLKHRRGANMLSEG